MSTTQSTITELKARIDTLRAKYKSLERHAKMHGEGYGNAEDFGGWTSTDEKALSEACRLLREAEFAAGGWDAATTAERRARWNAAMRVPGVDISHAAIAKLEKSLGFTNADLREAVRRHA